MTATSIAGRRLSDQPTRAAGGADPETPRRSCRTEAPNRRSSRAAGTAAEPECLAPQAPMPRSREPEPEEPRRPSRRRPSRAATGAAAEPPRKPQHSRMQPEPPPTAAAAGRQSRRRPNPSRCRVPAGAEVAGSCRTSPCRRRSRSRRRRRKLKKKPTRTKPVNDEQLLDTLVDKLAKEQTAAGSRRSREDSSPAADAADRRHSASSLPASEDRCAAPA